MPNNIGAFPFPLAISRQLSSMLLLYTLYSIHCQPVIVSWDLLPSTWSHTCRRRHHCLHPYPPKMMTCMCQNCNSIPYGFGEKRSTPNFTLSIVVQPFYFQLFVWLALSSSNSLLLCKREGGAFCCRVPYNSKLYCTIHSIRFYARYSYHSLSADHEYGVHITSRKCC